MCFISNISLMNIALTSEFCVFKSMWRSQLSTVVELTAIWYYVMLMWCHYNDKWAVNFNVLMFFETIVYKTENL